MDWQALAAWLNELNPWVVKWEIWAIAGLVLVVIDVLLDGSGYILSLGAGCFAMCVLAGVATFLELTLIPDWRMAAVELAAFSCAAMLLLKWLRPHNADEDVNRY